MKEDRVWLNYHFSISLLGSVLALNDSEAHHLAVASILVSQTWKITYGSAKSRVNIMRILYFLQTNTVDLIVSVRNQLMREMV